MTDRLTDADTSVLVSIVVRSDNDDGSADNGHSTTSTITQQQPPCIVPTTTVASLVTDIRSLHNDVRSCLFGSIPITVVIDIIDRTIVAEQKLRRVD